MGCAGRFIRPLSSRTRQSLRPVTDQFPRNTAPSLGFVYPASTFRSCRELRKIEPLRTFGILVFDGRDLENHARDLHSTEGNRMVPRTIAPNSGTALRVQSRRLGLEPK